MLLPGSRFGIARVALWILDQTKMLRRFHLDRFIIRWIKSFRKDPVVVWVKQDHVRSNGSRISVDLHEMQVNHLVEAMLYIRKNELTARVLFVHAYTHIDRIPSELKANIKILDEAFPSITLDLVFVKGSFEPKVGFRSEERIEHRLTIF